MAEAEKVSRRIAMTEVVVSASRLLLAATSTGDDVLNLEPYLKALEYSVNALDAIDADHAA